MPEAVKTFFSTHDINRVIQVQKNILDEYRDDMVKYARSEDKSRIRECFNSIPRQLSRDNKKFTYSIVRKGGRSKEYIGSLQWIEDAGIIQRCYNLQMPELPLSGNAVQDCFKIYTADTGLFVSMLDEGTQGDILSGNLYNLFEYTVILSLNILLISLYFLYSIILLNSSSSVNSASSSTALGNKPLDLISSNVEAITKNSLAISKFKLSCSFRYFKY